MLMKKMKGLKLLDSLLHGPVDFNITDDSKIIIFSDLHMGNGGSRDDFAHNGKLFLHLLKEYYHPQGYYLVLNGDVEELYRFSLNKVVKKWAPIYDMWKEFYQAGALTKIIGNHDSNLKKGTRINGSIPVRPSLKLDYRGNIIFICHGHQAGFSFPLVNPLTTFLLRYIATPLGIKNYSVAFNSRKKYRVEKRLYDFAKQKKALTIIGHTHRPLFESLSKIDTLKMKIEQMCRLHPKVDDREQEMLEKTIKDYSRELRELLANRGNNRAVGTLYAQEPMVPCLFNSGCCIGGNGVTAIEISGGNIELVYWVDKERSSKYFGLEEYTPLQLQDSPYYRISLKREPLDYVFSRINLLT